MMTRIEVDVRTGQQQVITLSPEEEAAAIASGEADDAAMAPIIAQMSVDAGVLTDAKADPVAQYLVSHHPNQTLQYVRNQVAAAGITDLASAKAAITTLETLLGKLAGAIGASLRDKLR